jgi:hypothetical protein
MLQFQRQAVAGCATWIPAIIVPEAALPAAGSVAASSIDHCCTLNIISCVRQPEEASQACPVNGLALVLMAQYQIC